MNENFSHTDNERGHDDVSPGSTRAIRPDHICSREGKYAIYEHQGRTGIGLLDNDCLNDGEVIPLLDYDSEDAYVVPPPDPTIHTAFIGKSGDHWTVHVEGWDKLKLELARSLPSLAEARQYCQRLFENLLAVVAYDLEREASDDRNAATMIEGTDCNRVEPFATDA